MTQQSKFRISVLQLLLLFGSFIAKSQNISNYNNNWVFGQGSHINFTGGGPIVTSVTSTINGGEGVASISDGLGNLLFYANTDNNTSVNRSLYGANHLPMPNGTNLMSHESASQGIIITRDPENCNQYYVFYVSNTAGYNLRYSKVDMTLNFGFGDVIPGQKDILLFTTQSEQVTIVGKGFSKYFWVITRNSATGTPSDQLVAIELLPGGNFGTPVTSSFSAPPVTMGGAGYISFKNDYSECITVNYAGGQVNKYNFNTLTGVFTNKFNIVNDANKRPYSGCFNKNSTEFFMTYIDILTGNDVLRIYDLATSSTGGVFYDYVLGSNGAFFSCQLAPNDKLYINNDSNNSLHVVNDTYNPTVPNITLAGQTLPNLNFAGLNNMFYPYSNMTAYPDLTLGSQTICYNTTAIIGGTADSLQAIYSWTGQISTPSGWTTPTSTYLINPNATNPTTINLTTNTRFILTLLTECGDTILTEKEWVYLDSLSTPVISGNLSYCAGEPITPLISTPPLSGSGSINWYLDPALTSLAGTGTSFTPNNTTGSTTYYVVEQESSSMNPQTCTSFITPVTVTISPQIALCYSKQAARWYFGDSLGLNFLCASPPIPLNDGIAEGWGGAGNNNLEGTVTMSDINGNLLFYAFDTYVINKNHTVMPNGSGILCNLSSTMGFLSVPNPANPNKYYLFYVGATGGNAYYSEIDMSLNATLGDVVIATKNTLLRTGCVERITAVESCNNGTWVVIHDANNFYAYLVDASGISAPVISPAINTFQTAGQMMLSPTGRHLAISRDNGSAELYTFDNESGKICHKESLSFGGMGCSFSNNGRYLYVNGMFTGMYQYDVFATNVNSTAVLINDPFSSGSFLYGTMQLGPDCKLYTFGLGKTNGSVIEFPNNPGLSCNFQPESFPLSDFGRDSRYGLPNFIQSWFKDPTYVEPTITAEFSHVASCAGDTTIFTNLSTSISDCPNYLWNFGDPASGTFNTSSLENPSHVYTTTGSFIVTLTITERCQVSTITHTVIVGGSAITITGDTIVCDHNNVVLTATGGGTYSWFAPSWQFPGSITGNQATLTNLGNPMMGSDNEGWYYVTVTNGACTATDSIYVTILPSPDVTISSSSGACSTTLTAVINLSNGPISNYNWSLSSNPSNILGTSSSVNVNPTINSQYQVLITDSAGCTAGALATVAPLPAPAAPIIYTPDSWYCVGDDNIATLNSSNGTHWYSDAGLSTQVGTGASFTPPTTVGVTTYYVINNTAGCISASANVDVEFSNCPTSTCSSNLITNGDFETYTSCPTNTEQISLATGWLANTGGGSANYYNTDCFGYYNTASYYPYFDATNYNLGLNGGGFFPPPSGDGYASIVLGGTFIKQFLTQQVNLACSKEYTLEFRAAIPRSDALPDNTLCVYGSNVAPPYSSCDPNLTLLGCLTNPSVFNNNWTPHSITFTPPANFSYMAITGQCPTGTFHGGSIFIDDVVLCGDCINPPIISSTSEITPASCAGSDGVGTAIVSGCNGTYTYDWQNTSSLGTTVSTQNTPNNLTAGTYSIIVTDGGGCTATSSLIISSNTIPPTVTAVSSGSITCTTLNVTLTGASAGNSLVWNGGSLPLNSPNPAIVTTAGTYTVTATDATTGCTNTSTIVVLSNTTPPTATAGAPLTLTCTTLSGNITASSNAPGASYSWSGIGITAGSTSSTATVNSAGTYTVAVTDPANGCTATTTVSVTTDTAPPTVTAGAPLVLTCTTLSGNITASSNITNSTYNWTGAGITSGGTTASATVNTTGTYTVMVTDPTNGCTATATVSVSSNTTPPSITAGSPIILTCSNLTGNITASSTTSGVSYNWTGAGIIAGGATSTATVSTAGTYTVAVTDPSNGCTATTTVSVSANNLAPNVTAGTSTPISCTTGLGNINASSTTPGVTYSWSGTGIISGGATSSPTVNTAGTYTVTVTDPNNGCTATTTLTAVNTPGPTASAGADVTIVSGTSATLTATGGGTYLWNTGETTSSITVSPTTTTDYCVTVTDGNGCTESACVRVTVDIMCGELFVPNAFSPNGDLNNDVFRVKIDPSCVLEMSLSVYDRWGEKIIELTDPTQFWDGTFKGKQLDNAVFVYYLNITLTNSSEEIKKSGNVSLIK